jgi:hypothetical protein
MRQIATLFIALMSLSDVTATAQESLMNDYINTFEGRWVCDAPAVQDIDGYWKKGEDLQRETVYVPQPDRSGMRYEVKFAKDGKSITGAHGICTWDSANDAINNYAFAPPGFLIEVKVTKDADKWTSKAKLTYPDGSVSHSTVAISVSEDGKTHTVVLLEGVDKNGEELEKYTRVWKKISKNQEVLQREFGWIIGVWDCQLDVPGLGTLPIEAKYKWVADKHVIQADMTFGEWKGLSLIFYDPSDEKIKMWGANSGGGNGQAVLEINGNDLTWTNTVFEGDGRKLVSDFTYVKQSDPNTFVVKFRDVVDDTQKQVTVTKRN